jgi:hypothetical protein
VHLAVIVVLVVAAAAPGSEIKTDLPGIGPEKILLNRAEPTTAGSFDGTWIYVNRDMRFALWMRTKDGVPQARLEYQSLASPEAFETDWDGKAVYYLGGNQVTFELKLGKATADQIQGTWSWILQVDTSARRETADIVMYRTLYGRSLLMDFQNYQKIITRNGKNSVMKVPVNWTWSKISKRELLWDELPF